VLVSLAALPAAHATPREPAQVNPASRATLERAYKKVTPPVATVSRIVGVRLQSDGPTYGTVVGKRNYETMSTKYCLPKTNCFFDWVVRVKFHDTPRLADVTGSFIYEDATVKKVNGIKIYSSFFTPRAAVVKVGKVVVELGVGDDHLGTVTEKKLAALAKAHRSRG
jgi:hypothetical protein